MSTDAVNPSLYVIDAHSLIFQVFHAIPEMRSPTALPTNALYGFTRDILHIRNERKPTYLIVAFDVSGPTFRDKMYAEYKAHRSPMPDDLALQIPMIKEMLEAMRVPELGIEGYEADDIIATLAFEGPKRGLDVFICSSDKDCRQLLSERVKIYNLRKREIFDAASLLADWGVRPEQVIDYQTLVGDSVDNVKGVPGIGPKTATTLLQQFGSLDNLLARVAEVPGKKQEYIRASMETLPLSKKLVTLATDVPLEYDWEQWTVQPWDGPRLMDLFRSWNFRGLAEQVRTTLNGAAAPKAKKASSKPVQGSLFDDMPATPEEQEEQQQEEPGFEDNWQATYHLINDEEKFATFLAELKKQKRFAIDLETTSLEPRRCCIVGLAFSWQAGEGWYVAVRGPEGETSLDPELVLAQLRPILEDPAVVKVNQNIKYDMQALRQHGVMLAGVGGDSMVADYLLHAGERSHNMEVLAEKHLQHRVIPITDLIGKGKNQKRMDQVPCARVAEYSGEDADVAWRLCDLLEQELQLTKLKRPNPSSPTSTGERGEPHLYDDLEIPLIEVLADMEYSGIRLDLPFLFKLGEEMTQMLAGYEKDIFELAGREFNIASVKQLREVLFREQGFKSERRTMVTNEASTDQETLERLARQGHALPKKLLDHRQISKLKGTYVDALPALVNPETGRVHASFNQTVASTGRLSSSDPNLQNIPIRSDLGGNIRRAFLPAESWKLLAADYSQIELRLLAQLSGDPALRQAFAENRDIHASVASQVFGVPESEVTPNQRRMAKTINFGLVYGISAFGLAFRLEVSKQDAAKFIDAYFAKYPRVLTYQEELLARCRERGYASTMLGRRRAIAGIGAKRSYRNRNQPEREAINMEIQGSAADLIKVAMVNLFRRFRKEKLRTQLLLQIHDELVFEIPPEEVSAVVPIIRQEMTGAMASHIQVPLQVDMALGDNWLDTEEVAG